jgi:ferredoxin
MTNIKLVGTDFFSQFNKNACSLCGDCFNKCPVKNLSKEDSIEEIKNYYK